MSSKAYETFDFDNIKLFKFKHGILQVKQYFNKKHK